MRARESAPAGATMNPTWFARVGVACCFKKSFSASARGWGSPARLTLFGPFRRWARAKNLRSNSV